MMRICLRSAGASVFNVFIINSIEAPNNLKNASAVIITIVKKNKENKKKSERTTWT